MGIFTQSVNADDVVTAINSSTSYKQNFKYLYMPGATKLCEDETQVSAGTSYVKKKTIDFSSLLDYLNTDSGFTFSCEIKNSDVNYKAYVLGRDSEDNTIFSFNKEDNFYGEKTADFSLNDLSDDNTLHIWLKSNSPSYNAYMKNCEIRGEFQAIATEIGERLTGDKFLDSFWSVI